MKLWGRPLVCAGRPRPAVRPKPQGHPVTSRPARGPAADQGVCPTGFLPYLLLVMLLVGCGYHVTGHGDTLPKTLNTIAIPAFGNTTTRQALARLLAADTTREFLSRTRYKVIQDPNQADAVLHGILTEFAVNPIIFDPKTGRATTVHVRATIQISLVERATGKTIVSRPNMQWDERYEVNANPQAYFDESSTAIQRVSQSMAHAVVSTILENF